MDDISEFKLSRIQAEGWNAAQKYLISGNPSDEKKIAALNPHSSDTARARWFAGFNNARDRL
jgi:hypothetical protein